MAAVSVKRKGKDSSERWLACFTESADIVSAFPWWASARWW
jgi:hypothetical protein